MQTDTTRRQRYILALYEGRINGRPYSRDEIADILHTSLSYVAKQLRLASIYGATINCPLYSPICP